MLTCTACCGALLFATSAMAEPAGQPEVDKEHAPQKVALELGGLWTQGIDATSASTRGGGGYAGATYWTANGKVPVFARYTVAQSTIVDRIAQPAGGSTLDVAETSLRHTAELGVGYRLELMQTAVVPWLLPFVSPRALMIVDPLAPQWAIELGGGARAGITVHKSLELSGLIAYHGAVVATDTPRTVYGAPIGELRFGGELSYRAARPLWITFGYEGNITSLEHSEIAIHQVYAGISARF